MTTLATLSLLALMVPSVLAAQSAGAPRRDTLSLGDLHNTALSRDARAAIPDLLRDASALRDRDIAADRRLRSAINANATHQSDVTALPIRVPGTDTPTPPYSRFQVTLDLEQSLYDAGVTSARRAIERARLGEAESDVSIQLFRLRQEVNAAVFTALLMQDQLDEFDVVYADMEQRLRETRARVLEGAALGRDTSTLVAEQLRVDEARSEVRAGLRTALNTLFNLTGYTHNADTRLTLEPVEPVTPYNTLAEAPHQRPEYQRFSATRERLAEEARAAQTENRPRLSAFVQAGVGRPGLNQLATNTDPFYLAGLRASWRPFERATVQRREEQIQVQQRVTELEERAFTDALERSALADQETVARLDSARSRDARNIAARTEIEQTARLEFTEGVATAATWVAARTSLMEARFAARRHEIEREYARARLLTTLGIPLR